MGRLFLWSARRVGGGKRAPMEVSEYSYYTNKRSVCQESVLSDATQRAILLIRAGDGVAEDPETG